MSQNQLAPNRIQEDALVIEVRKLDEIAKDYAERLSAPTQDRLARMLYTARGVLAIRRALTQKIMDEVVMPLMNSELGFKCDKEDYSRDVVREVVIVALLRGFLLTDNEFNIIAGRFYGAQAGYYRKLIEIEGLTDLEVIPGIPVVNQGSATIPMVLKCKIDGKPWSLNNSKGEPGRVFPIRVNSGMGADAIIGKAKRKAFKAAFEEITQTQITEADDGEDAAPALSVPTPPNGHAPLRAPTQTESQVLQGFNPPQQQREPGDESNDGGQDGATQTAAAQPGPDQAATEEQVAEMKYQTIRTGIAGTGAVDDLARKCGAKRYGQLTVSQADVFLSELRGRRTAEAAGATAPKARQYADV